METTCLHDRSIVGGVECRCWLAAVEKVQWFDGQKVESAWLLLLLLNVWSSSSLLLLLLRARVNDNVDDDNDNDNDLLLSWPKSKQ